MSDITSTRSSHAVYGGSIVDVAETGLQRAMKMLEGIEGGAYKAVGSALSRAANAGKTEAKRAVTQEYSIGMSDFLSNTKNINHFVKGSNEISVAFGYRGYVIPLIKFNTKYGKDGRVVTQVKRTNAAAILNHAFFVSMNNHTGVFEREGTERFPIKELYGPATPQMMYSNEDVMDSIEDKIVKEFDKRIEHEITRILNGYGG